MEVGKKYKVVWKDNDYTKVITGILILDELHLIAIDDIKVGKVIYIGKNAVTSIKGVEE